MENREIKFRAWATESRKMIDLKAITPLACDLGLLEHGDGLFIPFRKDIILMQFTGLKDKNGKEIYEGDILKYDYKKDTVTWETFNEAVEWSEMKDYVGFDIHTSMAHYEVIGTVYENPELVK